MLVAAADLLLLWLAFVVRHDLSEHVTQPSVLAGQAAWMLDSDDEH